MPNIENQIRRLGGLASSRELYTHPDDREFVRIAHRYGRIVHVCRGWWATREVHCDVLDARRAGGRLACISAVRFHAGLPARAVDGVLHVSVPGNASRLRGRVEGEVIYHWHRKEPEGSVLAVGLEAAQRQMARCSAVER